MYPLGGPPVMAVQNIEPSHIPEQFDFCSIAALKRHGRITRWIEVWRDELTAVRVRGRIHVFSSVCPHFGGELYDVDRRGERVRCRWHGWEFDLSTGRCVSFSAKCRVRQYPFRENGDRLEICLPCPSITMGGAS
jgi:nitrite reductase (NADH) small subunit